MRRKSLVVLGQAWLLPDHWAGRLEKIHHEGPHLGVALSRSNLHYQPANVPANASS